ncbi:MAG: cobalamin-binding protein [Chloroflexi bacterium]|jgi:iron complex transport system substrate-binding protein|nr:cobalamin-binding protein [Chloroflexota bacterium]
MKRFWLKTLVAVVLILALAPLGACDDNDADTTTPKNNLATDEAPDKSSLRIVSLAPSNTEVIFALGLGDNLVGVTEYCDYPPEAEEKAKIGGFSTVDMEKVIEVAPDLVVATSMHEESVTPELERRGLKVITLAPETLTEVLDGIIEVGAATGKEGVASELVAQMQEKINAVIEKVEPLLEGDKPGVMYVTWHDPIWTVGNSTLTHELIEIAGGENVFADGDGNMETDLETVVWRNPQVILASIGHGSAEDSPVTWANTEGRLSGLDALKDGRVYGIDANLVTRPGPRLVEGLQIVAEYLYPSVFVE